MLVSGFNHAYKPSDFARLYAANDKPLIYHFDDGKTLVMNKQDNGYAAVANGKLYVLSSDGMTTQDIGGGSGKPPYNVININWPVDSANPVFEPGSPEALAVKALHDEHIPLYVFAIGERGVAMQGFIECLYNYPDAEPSFETNIADGGVYLNYNATTGRVTYSVGSP